MAVLKPHLALTVTAGLAAFDEMDTTCCYARQDRIWVRDPDGSGQSQTECCGEVKECCAA